MPVALRELVRAPRLPGPLGEPSPTTRDPAGPIGDHPDPALVAIDRLLDCLLGPLALLALELVELAPRVAGAVGVVGRVLRVGEQVPVLLGEALQVTVVPAATEGALVLVGLRDQALCAAVALGVRTLRPAAPDRCEPLSNALAVCWASR